MEKELVKLTQRIKALEGQLAEARAARRQLMRQMKAEGWTYERLARLIGVKRQRAMDIIRW